MPSSHTFSSPPSLPPLSLLSSPLKVVRLPLSLEAAA